MRENRSKTENFGGKNSKDLRYPHFIGVDKTSRRFSSNREYGLSQIRLSENETANLRCLMQKHQMSLHLLIQGVWSMLLSRYSGEEDVLFGGKSETADKSIFPVRVQASPQESALSWLKKLEKQLKEQRQFGQVSLEQIRAWSDFSTEVPLFSSVVFFEDSQSGEETGCSLILMSSHDSGISLQINYDKSRFEEAVIIRMLGHLRTLLAGIAANPEQPVSNFALLTEAEQNQILTEWNETTIPYPEDSCLHQLFEAQVERTPDATALIFQDQKLAYKELNYRSNQLAHYLRNLGVGPDVLVGVFMERSIEMVIGLYGILKAGGAYVPIDPSYPKERLTFMIEDTQAPVLLTQQHLVERLPDNQAATVAIDSEWKKISQKNKENPDSGVTPEHLAYVIYTSGSTGRPKGAVLNHRGRVNNFCDFNRRYSVGAKDRVLGLASLSFDMHAYDIFGLMAVGGTTIVVEGSANLEPARWAELMIKHKITVWHSVPALLEMLVNTISERTQLWPHALRLVLLGGDWIPVDLPDRLKAMVKKVRVVSMGGATECSMDSTIYDIIDPSSAWKSIPYGVPMANQLAYVLDPHLNPVPVGVPGELYLGGVGVGRGYLNRPRLSAEKFIPNPFNGVAGDRMYRTGDLARYMPDGNLELLGRIDFQVKVRGYRIELGEIVSTLSKHPAVKEAVVVARGEMLEEKNLVAYVVPELKYQQNEEAPSQEWQSEQISQWQAVYEDTYSQSTPDDPTFNIIGWNSSYTGLPIPEEEMREWVKQSVDRVLALKPRRALELACGTGLLLFPIAPHVEKYLGIDFSAEGLSYIRRQLAKPELQMPQVSLMQRMADNFDGIEANSFDFAILHSVVQLFPGIDYLIRVLEGAVNSVEPGGFIYVGDVISLPLLEAFHTSVQLYQAPPRVSREQLKERVQKARGKEEQLFIEPGFFKALMQHLPKITHAQIQLRRGRFLNEMTRFRYDVILHIGDRVNSEVEIDWLDWEKEGLSVPKLRRLIDESEPEFLGVAKVPNARLASESKAMELLANSDGPETVGELREVLSQFPPDGFVDPEDIWAIGDELPYDVEINWSGSRIQDFDVLFKRKNLSTNAPRIKFASAAESNSSLNAWSQYANSPLQSVLARKLVPELRTYLHETLPDYMVPTAFVLLDSLPLSPNGKIDRRALPPPDQTRRELSADFAPPDNPIEEVVAQVWAEVFEFEEVGVQDNFLEIGGHSLLATQIMTRLQDLFPVELPLRFIFASPTVKELAKRIEEAGKAAGVDVMEVARTLKEIEELSEEDMRALLTEEERAI